MTNIQFLKLIINKWGIYIGFIADILGILVLVFYNEILGYLFLLLGIILILVWLWGIWHQGLRVQLSILKANPILDEKIYTDSERNLAKWSFIVLSIIILGVLARKSCIVIQLQEPTQTPEMQSSQTLAQAFTQSVTLTLMPTKDDTSSITPTSTVLFIPTETSTPTLTPQPTLPDYFITDCIEYGVWNVWGIKDKSTPIPDKQNRRCYDLSEKYLTAQKKRLDSTIQGLRINITSNQKTMNGIYLPLDKELDLKLSLEIEQFTSDEICKPNELCDVNLIIGFGDPYNGWLLVYRTITEDSPIYTCLFETIDATCIGEKQFANESGDKPLVHDLQFIRNGQDIEIIIDGEIMGNKSIFGMNERLWIGYQIRRHGTIKAFFQFK